MTRDPAPWIVLGLVAVLGMHLTRGLFPPKVAGPAMATDLLAAPSVLQPSPYALGNSPQVIQPSYGTIAGLLASTRTSSLAGRLAAQQGIAQVDIGAAQ